MAVRMRQNARMGWYLLRQRLAGREKFPLIVELEPLFQCNLACSGCGKIQHPEHELRRRMPVEQAVGAVEECGAPMVSIAGGEPLIHPEIHVIAAELVQRKKFVYLCTNALLLERKLDRFKPSPYFAWAIHIDGLRERHDESVEREGVFDKAVAAIRAAKAAGFRVTTNTTFFTHDSPKTVRDVLDFLNDELEVDEMMISPAYAYEKAPDQEHFLGVQQTRELFQRGVRRRPAPPLAAEPQPAVPRLPRGQGRIRLHRVGDPELLAVRLAASLLPHVRRLRGDLRGADRDDRLEQLRARTRPALRELHGALRLRADCRAADDALAAPVTPRSRRLTRRALRADVPPGEALAEQRRDAERERGDDLDGLQDDPVGDGQRPRRRRRRRARRRTRPGRPPRSTASPAAPR